MRIENLENLEQCSSEFVYSFLQQAVQGMFSQSSIGIPSLEEAGAYEGFIRSGFSTLESLYFLCGPALIDSGLLSRETKKIAQKLWDIEVAEEEGGRDRADSQLQKIMKDLDEKIFLHNLKTDSAKLHRLLPSKGTRV